MSRFRFLAAVTGLLICLGLAAHPRSQTALPSAAAPTAGAPTVVGATTCGSCHQQEHDTWTNARHGKMLQRATTTSVEGDFSKQSVTLRGDLYGLHAENGRFFVTESYVTGKEEKRLVEYTLGSRRIQHYLTTLPNGQMVVLPPSWDVRRREWFHNMEIVRPGEDAQKRVQVWNRACVGCHVSQEVTNYNPASRSYATKWMDFGTSCERCHGPGSAHVERSRQYPRSDVSLPVGERRIIRPTRLDPKTSSTICAQCHSLWNGIALGYTAGEDYYNYFQPVLEYGTSADRDPTYWADGRPRAASNDAVGLWESQCFLRGGATCTSCHNNPHEPDIDRNPQLGATSNALCTQCHQDIGAQLTTHTRHLAGSTGSRCVECHMPKAVQSIKATIRDHTMSLPAPENTAAFGIPNACTECHLDRKAPWAVEAVKKLWPENRRAKVVARAEAFTAGRARRPEALERLIAIAGDDRHGPFIQANAVEYLRNYPEARTATALLSALRAAHPLIRSIAASSLRSFDRPDSPVRSALVAALDDPERAVRIAALLTLANSARGPLAPEDQPRFLRVSREYAAAATLHEDDAASQFDLGFLELVTGQFDRAAAALANSLGLEPDRPSTRYLFGLARLGQGRLEDAGRLLRGVLSSDPA